MRYRIITEELAQEELEMAIRWYNGKERGLGAQFRKEYEKATTELEKLPKIYPIILPEEKIRKMQLKRYSYSIYYRVNEEKNEVQILRVWHNKRDDWWKTMINGG